MKIAINGFGRIGRQCLRWGMESKKLQFVAINDLGTAQSLAHLFKYDSVHPTYVGKISVSGEKLEIDGHGILMFRESQIEKLQWEKIKVDLVLECTGKFVTRNLAALHLKGSVKKVIVSAPCIDADITIVMGVNESQYKPSQHHVISNASCTTNCAAVIMKVLFDHVGIERATMSTVHSFTSDQVVLDCPHRDLRRARSAFLSMIPTTSGATKSLVKIFPELKGSFEGLSVRVPTPDVSLIDLVVGVKKSVTVSDINELFKEASQGKLKKYLGYTVEPLVSSDYIGNQHSAVIDASLTQVIGGKWVRVIAWYDNEVGFSRRLIDLVEYIYGN